MVVGCRWKNRGQLECQSRSWPILDKALSTTKFCLTYQQMEPTSPSPGEGSPSAQSPTPRLRPSPVDTSRSLHNNLPPGRQGPATVPIQSPPLSPFASFASNLSPLSHHSSPLTSPPNPSRRRRPMSSNSSLHRVSSPSPLPNAMPPTALSSSLGHEAMDYASPHMPLHTDGGWGAGSTSATIGRRELQSPGLEHPREHHTRQALANTLASAPPAESPSATVISTGSGSNSNPLTPTHSTHGSTHHHPHATSSTSFKHGFKHQPNQHPTTIEHIRIQNSLPTTPTRHQPAPPSLSSEHNLMMMNDPLRAATNGSGFQPTTTNKGEALRVRYFSTARSEATGTKNIKNIIN